MSQKEIKDPLNILKGSEENPEITDKVGFFEVVLSEDKKINMNFSEPTDFVGMNVEQAMMVSQALFAAAQEADPEAVQKYIDEMEDEEDEDPESEFER